MNLQRLLALRVQVAAVLATIDADISAETDTQDVLGEDPTEAMGGSPGESICPTTDDPVSLCQCPVHRG